MKLGIALWAGLLPRWRRRGGPEQPGYTLLLPVPGDLPVFARLAIDVCRAQRATHRVETLVISDLPSPHVRAVVEEAAPGWPGLTYVAPGPHLRPVLRALNDPGRFHGVQLVLGTQRASGTHVLLHDADAILIDPGFLDGQYRAARAEGIAAVGVHPLWDEWLRGHRPDLVATWEMCARRDWLTSVPPFRHLAHPVDVAGTEHVADTTVYAQLRTGAGRLVLHGDDAQFVHFNYVVSTYRRFQAAAGSPFEDTDFRLLFVRALTDALAVTEAGQLPTAAALAGCLASTSGPVTYPARTPEKRGQYATFRRKLDHGMAAVYGARPDVLARLSDVLEPFDRHYGHDRDHAGGPGVGG